LLKLLDQNNASIHFPNFLAQIHLIHFPHQQNHPRGYAANCIPKLNGGHHYFEILAFEYGNRLGSQFMELPPFLRIHQTHHR